MSARDMMLIAKVFGVLCVFLTLSSFGLYFAQGVWGAEALPFKELNVFQGTLVCGALVTALFTLLAWLVSVELE